jgi:hypothetical protein
VRRTSARGAEPCLRLPPLLGGARVGSLQMKETAAGRSWTAEGSGLAAAPSAPGSTPQGYQKAVIAATGSISPGVRAAVAAMVPQGDRPSSFPLVKRIKNPHKGKAGKGSGFERLGWGAGRTLAPHRTATRLLPGSRPRHRTPGRNTRAGLSSSRPAAGRSQGDCGP